MSNKHTAEISPLDETVTVSARINGSLILETSRALELREHHNGQDYAPVLYFPRDAIDMSRLTKNESHSSHCPIKGDASYYSLKTGLGMVENIAWSYEDPIDHVAEIKNYLGFDGRFVTILRQP